MYNVTSNVDSQRYRLEHLGSGQSILQRTSSATIRGTLISLNHVIWLRCAHHSHLFLAILERTDVQKRRVQVALEDLFEDLTFFLQLNAHVYITTYPKNNWR